MKEQQEQLETLKEIRTLMENSSRFLSLSGLIGVLAGITALAGVAAAYIYLGLSVTQPGYYMLAIAENGETNSGFYTFLIIDISAVFIISLVAAASLTIRKAKKLGQPVWNATAKRLCINLALPIIAGGAYCFVLLYHGLLAFIAPATLLFYGLALINASKYTLNDIRNLGIIQIILGLAASVYVDYGLLFWAFGFGVMHIVYGITMYIKYDK